MKYFLTSLVLVFAFVCSGLAHAGDAFTVQDIAVEATAESAAKAREAAMQQVERQGLQVLLKRLTLSADHSLLGALFNDPAIRDNTSRYVRSLEVKHEKASATHYSAKVDMSFYPDAVTELLNRSRLAYAAVQSRPVVIVPLYWADGSYKLWERNNMWWLAWENVTSPYDLVPVIVPQTTRQPLTLQQALDKDRNAFAEFAKAYKTTNTILALAYESRPEGAEKSQVRTSYIWFGPTGGVEAREATVELEEGEELFSAYRRAAAKLYTALQEDWKRKNMVSLSGAEQGYVEARVQFENLQDWIDIKKRLDAITTIKTVEADQFTRTSASLRLTYDNDIEQLQISLAQQGLALEYASSEVYLKRLPN